MYQFKGVKNAEQIYALGTEEKHLQPPFSGEKVKRIGGKKKIKVKLRNKKLKEIIMWFIHKAFIVSLIYIIVGLCHISINFHANNIFYQISGINLNYIIGNIVQIFIDIFNYIKSYM